MDVIEHRVSDILSERWSLLLLRGLAAIAFGLLTWFRPAISLTALVLLFGAYALVDGILATWTAIEGRKEKEYWWVMLLGGLVGIGVGLLTFFAPGLTAIGLLFYIATWAIAHGVLEIAVAIRVRKEVHGEWRLIVAGIVSVFFGVLLMARPGAGALTALWLIGTYAVAFGILMVMLAFKARSFGERLAHA
jgi:uncharacterized membrane protein HdeD (DUF308 family)